MKIIRTILITFFGFAVLASCTSGGSIASKVTLTPSKTAVVGKVNTSFTGKVKPLANTAVRLAKVFWNSDQSDGAYVLEGGTSPSTITNKNGEFVFENIEPADYVVVVGNAEGDFEIISAADGKAKIFKAEPDKILDIGTLDVKLRQGS
jgi:hypothetical protein